MCPISSISILNSRVEIYGSIQPSVVTDTSTSAPRFLRVHDLVRGQDYVGYVYHHAPSSERGEQAPSLVSLGRYCKGKVWPVDIVAGAGEMRTGSKVLCQVKDIQNGIVLTHVRCVPLSVSSLLESRDFVEETGSYTTF